MSFIEPFNGMVNLYYALTFQAVMNDLFCPFLHRFILVFYDDLLIYSQDIEQHGVQLEQALKLLYDNQFFVKLSKCCFGQTKVNFLDMC